MASRKITLEKALSLISLPREIGIHPETGKTITATIGRYGPYLTHDGKYAPFSMQMKFLILASIALLQYLPKNKKIKQSEVEQQLQRWQH